jgi:Asp-tRNA(Asn)/Glu-tRNA(Gln) amidotransferase A subunit family amidase
MSLPHQQIAWDQLDLDMRGLKISLWLDAGWGMALDAEVRAATVAAARAFEQAGAIVEPLPPFTTRAMIDGLDAFWRMRAWLEISTWSAERQLRVLPYIHQWAAGGAALSGEQVFRGFSQMGAIRDATVAATRAFDFVLSPVSPVVSFPAEFASPLNDPARPFEHIAFTLPFNFSEQPAIALNAGYSASGFPIGVQLAGRRHDDLGVLRIARAFEQCRGPQRAYPVL